MMGSPLLALLPVLAFLLLFAFLLARGAPTERDWRRSFLLATVSWASYLALTSEVLSLFRGISVVWVTLVWLLPVAVLIVVVRRTGALPAASDVLRTGLAGLSTAEKAMLFGIGLICGVLFAIALISPPNTYDSALYHLARVVHWAQNASLRPYPALFEHQLHKPIWAETAILHLRVLWGSDRPAGLVQWFSMVGSLVAVSGIAGLLRGGRGAQILAAAFCVSLPMGVMQASSTQNDYVSAFWAVVLAYFVLLSIRRELTRWELWALAGAAGLGALTKGTFYVYAPPFLIWFFFHEWIARGLRQALRGAIVVAAAAIVLNAGYWARNIEVYGGPYGSSALLQMNIWVRLPLESSDRGPSEVEPGASVATAESGGDSARPVSTATPGVAPPEPAQSVGFNLPGRDFLVRVAQTAGRNLTFPTGFLHRPVTDVLEAMPGVFGKTYADEMRGASWNSEDTAGNPLHLLFVPLSLLVLVVVRPSASRGLALGYALAALMTFALIPVVIGHGVSGSGIRYQLGFFVLWAPVVGAAFEAPGKGRAWRFLAWGFLLLSVPWLLLNRTRPLIGWAPERTWVGSILVEPQENLVFPWSPQLREDYIMAADAVAESGCTQVELRAYASYLEYPLWWLLEVPQSGIRVMSYQVSPYLEKYIDPAFEPCAVICANCDFETTARGLPLFGHYDSIKVYLEE